MTYVIQKQAVPCCHLDLILKMALLAHVSSLSHSRHGLCFSFFVLVTMQSQSLFANWWQSGWIIYPQTPLFLDVDPFFLWWIRTTHPAHLNPIVLFITDHFNKSYVISQCRPEDTLQAVFKSGYLPQQWPILSEVYWQRKQLSYKVKLPAPTTILHCFFQLGVEGVW